MNRKLFFKTPEDKLRVFQKPRLIMFSEGSEVESWANTQPLYFYPFSWLDYLGKEGIRELYIQDVSLGLAEKEINALEGGKVHFEHPNELLIKLAKERGHKVSVICNIEDLLPEQIEGLSISDFVRIRVNKNCDNLCSLSGLPNEHVLSCIKAYVGEGCNYGALALQAREIGFDFFHIAKRLENGHDLLQLSEEEKQKIRDLQKLETEQFRVVIPSSLEERFAKRFVITPSLGNVSSCDFSKYRLVLNGDNLYPCYTEHILALQGFRKEDTVKNPNHCLDCACIYENDMLHDIKTTMRRYKNPSFALKYIENGK
ncbi:MAG: hypothetical protein Q7S56_02730 [Nanoarchaeota archaeon]|nr:hypothetical protein [Nanoarchaeota archaeon]